MPTSKEHLSHSEASYRISSWWAFLLYSATAVALTWPVPAHLTTQIIGHPLFENWAHVWYFSCPNTIVHQGALNFCTPMVFFPACMDILTNFGSILNEFMMLGVTGSLGEVAAYNLSFLLSMVFSSLFAFLFIRQIGILDNGALFSGLVFGFSPYVFSEMSEGRTESGIVVYLSLFFWLFAKLLNSGTFRLYLASALAFLAITLGNLYHGAICFLFVAYYIAARIREAPHYAKWILLRRTLVLALLIAIPLIPVAFHFHLNTPTDDQLKQSGILIPPPRHGLVEPCAVDPISFFRLRAAPIIGNNMGNLFVIGLTPLLFSLIALALREKRVKLWLVGAVVFFIFSMGGSLAIGEHMVPLPWMVVKNLPLLNRIHMVHRFGLIVVFCVASAGGIGLAALTKRLRLSGKSGAFLVAAACVLTLTEFVVLSPAQIPPPKADAHIPGSYRVLQKAENGSSYEIPFHTSFQVNERYWYYQTFHGKPLVNGTVSNRILEADWFAFFHRHPLLRLLVFAQTQVVDPLPDPDQLVRWRQELQDDGLRFYVVHNCLLSDEKRRQVHHILSAAVGPPAAAEDNVVVYDANKEPDSRALAQAPDSCIQAPLYRLEKEIYRIMNQELSLPAVYHEPGTLSWKLRRLDKFAYDNRVTNRLLPELIGDAPFPWTRQPEDAGPVDPSP